MPNYQELPASRGHPEEELTNTPFLLDFAFATKSEGDHEGKHGLILSGYASRFNEYDQDNEVMLPGAFNSLAEEWGSKENRQILYHHGMDMALGTRVIGKCIDYKVDQIGLFVKVFIPEDVAKSWSDTAKEKFAEVYAGIKSGIITGFSVAGIFAKRGKALVRLAMQELSVTPNPCLQSATFVAGAKAIQEYTAKSPYQTFQGQQLTPWGRQFYSPGSTLFGYQDNPPRRSDPSVNANISMQEEEEPKDMGNQGRMSQSNLGMLSRKGWNSAMTLAQMHGDNAMHDHLLERPAWSHGMHDAEKCSICQNERASRNVKSNLWADLDEEGNQLLQDTKAVMKKEGDAGECSAACYLVVGDENEVSSWHLRVKDADGKANHNLMAAARAALESNHRGQPYEGPDKEAALAKLKKLYKAEDMVWDEAMAGKKAERLATKTEIEKLITGHSERICTILIDHKAGKRLSKKTKDMLAHHVDNLEALKTSLMQFLNEEELEPADDAEDDDEQGEVDDNMPNGGLTS